MIKQIDFPPYNRVHIIQMLENGGLLCCLYGEDVSDNGIVFPPDSNILNLTEEERHAIAAKEEEWTLPDTAED